MKIDLRRRLLSQLIITSPIQALIGSSIGHAQSRLSSQQSDRLLPSPKFREIGLWGLDQINHIIQSKIPAFSGIQLSNLNARYPVRLYVVEYNSTFPEQNNRPLRLSGLMAIPETAEKQLPLISYQHGVTFYRHAAPSHPEHSPETEAMIALCASQGYALIAADYIGKGISEEPQAYLVKTASQQTIADFIRASSEVLKALDRTPSHLFLAGWSQGGYVTMALLQWLEAQNIPVQATATAGAPTDLWVQFGAPLLFPHERPQWSALIYAIISFSYEYSYSVPRLAQSIIRPEFYEAAKLLYLQQNVDLNSLAVPLSAIINPNYFQKDVFANSAFGRLLANNDSYRWPIRTPTRNYYGIGDEAIRPDIARLPMTYQRALGNDKVVAIDLGDFNHRATFIKAAIDWTKWFDSQLRNLP